MNKILSGKNIGKQANEQNSYWGKGWLVSGQLWMVNIFMIKTFTIHRP